MTLGPLAQEPKYSESLLAQGEWELGGGDPFWLGGDEEKESGGFWRQAALSWLKMQTWGWEGEPSPPRVQVETSSQEVVGCPKSHTEQVMGWNERQSPPLPYNPETGMKGNTTPESCPFNDVFSVNIYKEIRRVLCFSLEGRNTPPSPLASKTSPLPRKTAH